MEPTTNRLSGLADDLADRTEIYADQAASTMSNVRDHVADAVEKGTDWAATKTRDVDATSRQLLASVCDSVSARPLVAVGIAAALGYVISRMVSRD